MTKKIKAACANCRKGLKKSWTTCPRCGRPVMARDRAAKAAAGPAFIAKSARPQCRRCTKASPAGSRFCVHCGTALLGVVKSAEQARREVLLAKIHAESDPSAREGWWTELHKMTGGPYRGAS